MVCKPLKKSEQLQLLIVQMWIRHGLENQTKRITESIKIQSECLLQVQQQKKMQRLLYIQELLM